MTTMTITPNAEKKKLAVAGIAAIGEPVAITVVGFASNPTADLHLRVIFQGHVVATFPMRPDDEWATSGDDLTCVLDLNTDLARMMCRAPENCCLFTLEDTGKSDVNTRRLWAIGEHELRGWPADGVAAHPYPLSKVPSLIQTWEAWISEWRTEVDNLDITATQTATGYSIVIKRKNGEETAVVLANGQDGQPGADGTSATIHVGQVTTLPAGSQATVENVGTPQEAVFDFAIPKGEKGEPGHSVFLDNTVTETSENGVKSSGIWSWVKSLLPSWLTPSREEPPTQASVAAKYTKPSGGIPKTDLAPTVQVSLGLADSALQSHQDISGKADTLECGTGASKQTATVTNGVVKLDDFFKESNSLLGATIEAKIANLLANIDPDTASVYDLIKALKGE